jgi:hypothetical protein
VRESFAIQEVSGNVLLEPELFVVSICLGPLFETLVLGENVVRSGEVSVSPGTKAEGSVIDTYGSIMRDRVFLSSSCLGPFHFFQTHLQTSMSGIPRVDSG